VQLGFRAGVDEVQTKLLFPAGYPEQFLAALVHDMAHRLGDFVFAVDGLEDSPGNLASVVDKLMTDAGKTLAVIETASQGLLAAKCPGSSWLLGALYAERPALGQRLGVAIDPENLPQTAARLAQALKNQTSADFILVQLYEGTREQFHDPNRTIILYNMLLLENDTLLQNRHCVAGAGGRKQNQAALLGLDLLRRHLQHLT
jgi:hypothetical protein